MNDKLNLEHTFCPCAMYFEESDILEYVSEDVPMLYRRVDQMLTLIISLDARNPIGVQLKGFKNFYLRVLRKKYSTDETCFLYLTSALEEALNTLGDDAFLRDARISSYETAMNIAQRDNVHVRDFPVSIAC